MSARLFLNGIRIDLHGKAITRRIQIAEVSEVGALKSSYSYTIKIPKTSKNTVVFDMLATIGNTSRKPYENVRADYVEGVTYLVQNGSTLIRESSKYYQINIIDGIRSLAELLSGKKLVDLPLDDLNHVLTTKEYTDSYQNTEGFIYGIANYGRGVDDNLKVEKQAPSIYIHTLFRRIFESAGLILEGEFFTTNENYLNEVLAPSKGYTVEDVVLQSDDKGEAETSVLYANETYTDFTSFKEKIDIIDIDLVGGSVVNGEIVFSTAGVYKMDLSILYSLFETYASVIFEINGGTNSYTSLPIGNSQTKNSTVTFTAEIGDVVSLSLAGGSNFDDRIGEDYIVSYSVKVLLDMFLQTGGQTIKPSDYIADLNQIDLIKDVVSRYGLILHPVQNTGQYKFKRIEAILNDRVNVDDWTSKLVGIKSEKYDSGYAQINKAKYNYPPETIIPSHDGEMLVDNVNTKTEKTIFLSPFEIPLESDELFLQPTYLIPIWSEGVEVVNGETKPKIMHIERLDEEINAKLYNEGGGITVIGSIPFFTLDFISLQYSIARFYKAFQNLIENYKKVYFLMNLSVIDIYNLDFFRLKFMKQTGRFYYLSSVQYTTDKHSLVEAVEISNFLQNLPPSQLGGYIFPLDHNLSRVITAENITSGYEDPELDNPLKIKFLNGFNGRVLLKQAGTAITSETEINFDILDLSVKDVSGTLGEFTESWEFAIADEGSGEYGNVTAELTANIQELINLPPIARAGDDQQQTALEPEFPFSLFFAISGAASTDFTGEIVSWVWTVQDFPSGASFELFDTDFTNPTASLEVHHGLSNIGVYTLRLTVTDQYGATDFDDVILTVISY